MICELVPHLKDLCPPRGGRDVLPYFLWTFCSVSSCVWASDPFPVDFCTSCRVGVEILVFVCGHLCVSAFLVEETVLSESHYLGASQAFLPPCPINHCVCREHQRLAVLIPRPHGKSRLRSSMSFDLVLFQSFFFFSILVLLLFHTEFSIGLLISAKSLLRF